MPIPTKKDVEGLSESQLQSLIKEALKAQGFTVLDTSVYGSPRVMRQAKMGAQSKGIPDLLVTHNQWPLFTWRGLEVKLPKGSIKPEQQALADAGRVAIVRSVEDAMEAVK